MGNEKCDWILGLLREKGLSIHNIAKNLKIGVGTTQRILAVA